MWLCDCFSKDQLNDGFQLLLAFNLQLTESSQYAKTLRPPVMLERLHAMLTACLHCCYLVDDGSQIIGAHFVEQALHLSADIHPTKAGP